MLPLFQNLFLWSSGWLANCQLESLGVALGKSNWLLYMEGKERSKEEADHSRLAGGRFNKKGNLQRRLALGDRKRCIHPNLPTRIIKVYIEALVGFGDIFSLVGLNNILCIF